MKIGILTFHASHNYGSMLQAYALQQYLLSQGHVVEEINLRNDVQRYQIYPYPLERPLGVILKLCLTPVYLYHECQRWKKYERFLQDNIVMSKKTYTTWEEIHKDIDKYDVVITGGDQIWNITCRDFDPSYFLPGDIKAKKISYCPSFGGLLSKITKEQESYIKEKLSEYDDISVREFSMKDYLEKLLNREIDVVVDPTLLLTKDDYTRILEKRPLVNGDYIFYYTPRENSQYEQLAILLGKYYGKKVITSYPRRYRKGGMENINDIGPSEFLNLINNACLVVGCSFHLVVFSLILHKAFVAINGHNDARISSFLKYLGISERGNMDEYNYKSLKLPPIDFKKTDGLINDLRESSVYFINRNIK